MSKIINKLFVGSLDEAFNDNITKDIQSMLNVASELDLLPRIEHRYKKISINDDDPNEDITVYINEAVEWIDNEILQNNSVLVHCLEGRSRSVCICIAYLIIKQNYTYEDAINHLKLYAKYYDPYPLYLEQLRLKLK